MQRVVSLTACYVCVFFFSHGMPVDVRVIVFYYIYKAFAGEVNASGCTDTKSQHTCAFFWCLLSHWKKHPVWDIHMFYTLRVCEVFDVYVFLIKVCIFCRQLFTVNRFTVNTCLMNVNSCVCLKGHSVVAHACDYFSVIFTYRHPHFFNQSSEPLRFC